MIKAFALLSYITAALMFGLGILEIADLLGANVGPIGNLLGLWSAPWLVLLWVLYGILISKKHMPFHTATFFTVMIMAVAIQTWEVPIHIQTIVFYPSKALLTFMLASAYLGLYIPLLYETRKWGYGDNSEDFGLMGGLIAGMTIFVTALLFLSNNPFVQFDSSGYPSYWFQIFLRFMWVGIFAFFANSYRKSVISTTKIETTSQDKRTKQKAWLEE